MIDQACPHVAHLKAEHLLQFRLLIYLASPKDSQNTPEMVKAILPTPKELIETDRQVFFQ